MNLLKMTSRTGSFRRFEFGLRGWRIGVQRFNSRYGTGYYVGPLYLLVLKRGVLL